MPSANVQWPVPLVRQRSLYPGMMGVPGTDTERGLRTSATGAIFYVDPNYPGASDGRDGTDPTAPLLTVAKALTLCQPYRGDVIAVGANNTWMYGDPLDLYTTAIAEEVEITVPGVRLVGLSSSAMGVYWYPASNGGTCITVSAIDVIIEGFCFSEGPTYTGCDGIYCEWDGTDLFGENLTVRHCTFDDTVDVAIQAEFSWWCDFHDNTFWGCDDYGIYIDVAGSGIAYTLIHDNVFHDCDVAMSLLGGCDDNQIFRNSIYNSNAQGAGAATGEGLETTGGVSNQVFDNYFSCLLPAGAPGDIDDLCSGSASDGWVFNHCTNGLLVTTPA